MVTLVPGGQVSVEQGHLCQTRRLALHYGIWACSRLLSVHAHRRRRGGRVARAGVRRGRRGPACHGRLGRPVRCGCFRARRRRRQRAWPGLCAGTGGVRGRGGGGAGGRAAAAARAAAQQPAAPQLGAGAGKRARRCEPQSALPGQPLVSLGDAASPVCRPLDMQLQSLAACRQSGWTRVCMMLKHAPAARRGGQHQHS